MEIILPISFCGFLFFGIGAIVLRFKLRKESPLKSIVYSYGLIFLGFLCLISIILIEQPKEFLFSAIFFGLVELIGLIMELFFAWAIRPELGKKYREELNEIFRRNQ